ncbi:hypothetical protein [Chengkuizengella axinellae]|uniref:Uncharacterized protein n=1 Tax=Chengkuizengella axinellae TaxID=3064388 RepID=A0ABT9J6H8_9BACL|nr:hypothetical protein [Chengkuizengella sp. 2205SS18-9]MDP5277237.1 hypothetical protein [Chengkuizengella sp. 2205SS18-9]
MCTNQTPTLATDTKISDRKESARNATTKIKEFISLCFTDLNQYFIRWQKEKYKIKVVIVTINSLLRLSRSIMNTRKIGIPTSIATIASKESFSIKNKPKTKIDIIIDTISGTLL